MSVWADAAWGSEFDRIARGELASSTERRLKELVRWGGFSSFLSPGALAAAAAADIEPVGQVVGLSTGALWPGYVRTTRPGQGRARIGVARWREHTGPLKAWATIRTRALARLTKQAELLGAEAVVGIVAEREHGRPELAVTTTGMTTGGSRTEVGEEPPAGVLRFTGTAVRVRSLRRATAPVLTLASAQELWAMLRAGVEPAGIAGGFASVETRPSKATVLASVSPTAANVELADLTESVYEVRRLAMERLMADARGLKADGLLGVDLQLEGLDDERRRRVPGLQLTVHVLASAVKRARTPALEPEPVVAVADG